MKKGDIILISFPFTDLTGSKLRPAIVLASSQLDVTVAFITTQLKWREEFDVLLSPTVANGLKMDSMIRLSKIATLDVELVEGKLGNVTMDDILLINTSLIKLFKLKN
ncbi:MAG: type II toxin-antitoxin system PemK/MazF family toxin [Cytophagales bacterium]|nr:type II toxin-antitoxin system PemK/MazF family toxin [Cytophagales bacterium]MCA6389228.1 type II toxin-antitoxin system PemK/MazF family toxin [Cytophagales bacterium]MCA6393442.1 type II toxin-antitoxin system PemK/MazF family toxin [Cytophagales bacterium]MCA6395691.1 type II toxin-antitoxin system PemK/MazF family toxin [Cytophagales bacterium]MCA6402952.1 type II toxin-antitoxin system PemK/MazF family toxin [Cytophagales bacterium]